MLGVYHTGYNEEQGKNTVKLPWACANPKQIYRGKKEELTEVVEKRKGAAVLWSNQVDAAAVVGADEKVDGSGSARVLRRREEEER